jgi:hypothetical protein
MLKFGHKIGRRVGTTNAVGATTLGLAGLPILFSKTKLRSRTLRRRKHRDGVAIDLNQESVESAVVTDGAWQIPAESGWVGVAIEER